MTLTEKQKSELAEQFITDKYIIKMMARGALPSGRTSIDQEELESEASYHYTIAITKYKPELGPLDRWLRRRTKFQFMETLRCHARQGGLVPTTGDYQLDTVPVEKPSSIWEKMNADLSQDAKAVLLGVLEGSIGDCHGCVWSCLGDLGWSEDRRRSAFDEIREALSETA